ncbi:unnamed protein product [Darwinula stevensoni]|uniref:Uncharacterized protein n=1 Tax=Darwinula stevensoni TaxID=69355 RepID=A0A7R9AAJ5_9CRUS|nr:unnamed protein product [Darwinula stevensoni]CAG0898481.1 unnamed protein product [Darwinula stevensoni]
MSITPDTPNLCYNFVKVAQLVAKMGPEGEREFKEKVKLDPKYSFLFGGPYFDSYQKHLHDARDVLMRQEQQLHSRANNGLPPSGVPVAQYNPSSGTSLPAAPVFSHLAQPASSHLAQPASSPLAQPASSPLAQPASSPLAQPASSHLGPPISTCLAPPSHMPPPATALSLPQPVPPLGNTADQWFTQIQQLQEQISRSEQNLVAQHKTLMQQQQIQIYDTFKKILQPIINSCTKDSISRGKAWILSHATTSSFCELAPRYLINKIIEPGATFSLKMHLIYLINNLLHHCVRKDLQKSFMEMAVTPMFCNAWFSAPENEERLENLLYFMLFPKMVKEMEASHKEEKEKARQTNENLQEELRILTQQRDEMKAQKEKARQTNENLQEGLRILTQQRDEMKAQKEKAKAKLQMLRGASTPAAMGEKSSKKMKSHNKCVLQSLHICKPHVTDRCRCSRFQGHRLVHLPYLPL